MVWMLARLCSMSNLVKVIYSQVQLASCLWTYSTSDLRTCHAFILAEFVSIQTGPDHPNKYTRLKFHIDYLLSAWTGDKTDFDRNLDIFSNHFCSFYLAPCCIISSLNLYDLSYLRNIVLHCEVGV